MSYDATCKGGFFEAKSKEARDEVIRILDEEAGIETIALGDCQISNCYGYGHYVEESFEEIPNLVSSGWLDFMGEDDSVWSLVFENGKVEDVPGEIIWRSGERRTS